MDTWMGNNSDPITLQKYLYANVDPSNVTDPTGHFGLASFGAANTIRAELSGLQIEIGLSLFDASKNTDKTAGQFAGERLSTIGVGSAFGRGVAILGGVSFKLLKMLSSKVRKACSENSFAGETLVSTEFGLKAISDIKIGDKVWAYDEETGENTLQDVIHLIYGVGAKELVDISLSGGEVITATAGHPMYSAGLSDWVDAGDLTKNDLLLKLDGETLNIENLRKYGRGEKVFNITVANMHTYFVGSNEVLGHNSGGCRSFKSFDVPKELNVATQERHIYGHRKRDTERGGTGSYFDNLEDARDVLNAVQDGRAIILGKTAQGNFLVHYKFGRGYNP